MRMNKNFNEPKEFDEKVFPLEIKVKGKTIKKEDFQFSYHSKINE